MPAMNDIELERLLAERMEEHEQWNAAVTPRSRGAKERDSTRYDVLSGPSSPRRLHRLSKAGVRDKHLPSQSIHIRLNRACPKAIRKGKMYGTPE
jgi:hypothetical protein